MGKIPKSGGSLRLANKGFIRKAGFRAQKVHLVQKWLLLPPSNNSRLVELLREHFIVSAKRQLRVCRLLRNQG